jgi:hypothetical protein
MLKRLAMLETGNRFLLGGIEFTIVYFPLSGYNVEVRHSGQHKESENLELPKQILVQPIP